MMHMWADTQALDGKVALIASGSSAIGFAAAKEFAARGAQVVITGCRQDAVDAAVVQIGTGAIGLVGDVADLAHHDAVAAEVVSRFGGLDIYMANAEVNTIRPSSQVTEAQYDAQFNVNTKAVFFGIQKMTPIMCAGGAIIITGSIVSDKDMAGHAMHAGSKAAIFAFARSWAIELKSRGIRVNVLSPGPVHMPVSDGECGPPARLGSAALFLASEASSLVTGINLRIDGGMSLL